MAVVFSFGDTNPGGADAPPDRLFSPLERITALKRSIRDPRRFSSSDAPDIDSDMVKSDMQRDFDLISSSRLFSLLDLIETQLKKRKETSSE